MLPVIDVLAVTDLSQVDDVGEEFVQAVFVKHYTTPAPCFAGRPLLGAPAAPLQLPDRRDQRPESEIELEDRSDPLGLFGVHHQLRVREIVAQHR